jgi:murein DD-endopeptidase MepM/ murein hydrolase activator NlpD
MLRRLAVAAVLALAAFAGTARAADSGWVVVPSTPVSAVVPASADVPSVGGMLAPDWLTPPAVPVQLDYPQLLALWQRAGAAYGIPWQVLAAINKVESNFGRNMGPSSAGAIGWMQFMPSTWLRWGTDGNGDGGADPWNPDDGVYSAARYLAASGGRGDIAGAIYSYNHADWYVREVLQYAQLFGDAGVQTTFSLDRQQIALEQAQTQLAGASDDLRAARRVEMRQARRRDALLKRADGVSLLSERIALQRSAGLADLGATAAHARVVHAAATLDSARNALETAREQSRASAFAPAAGTMLSAPTFDSGYVFPVGGGPSIVSASHTHHDYPAVDIAAPEGTPVYALANAVVVNAWSGIDPRCGIGVTMRTEDGREWTYCHLSYRDPSVKDGAVVAAGALVGLVGSTGDASGPHLHLQLQPATEWPQQMPWFQRFAGNAFRWQDGPGMQLDLPTRPLNPVFAQVRAKTAASSERVIAFTLK